MVVTVNILTRFLDQRTDVVQGRTQYPGQEQDGIIRLVMRITRACTDRPVHFRLFVRFV